MWVETPPQNVETTKPRGFLKTPLQYKEDLEEEEEKEVFSSISSIFTKLNLFPYVYRILKMDIKKISKLCASACSEWWEKAMLFPASSQRSPGNTD